ISSLESGEADSPLAEALAEELALAKERIADLMSRLEVHDQRREENEQEQEEALARMAHEHKVQEEAYIEEKERLSAELAEARRCIAETNEQIEEVRAELKRRIEEFDEEQE
ncbi:hypothetical protein, partial [Acinetobacter baumannii]|uniref:hypothetical protein n=1 Tax=Acinetobacter baumannii TaxID=470 RepID=UPI000B27CB17